MSAPLRRVLTALLLAAAASRRAEGTAARPFAFDRAAEAFEPAPALGIGDARMDLPPLSAEAMARPQELAAVPVETSRRRVFDAKTTRFTLGTTAAVLTFGYLTWWHESKGSWTFGTERWFGKDTYAGGADKVSHFVMSFNAEWGLETAYKALGHPESEARWLAVGVVAALGVLVEVGDGTTFYGASWEDATANLLGAIASSQISRFGLRDTVGARFGRVKAMIPAPCCRAGINYGSDYSREIYSLDLKLNGFLPRIGVKPGPARFLLISLTYGSKGYRFSWEDVTERNVGLDFGLNVPEILKAVGVPQDKLWGKVLITFFEVFRLPYTAYGFHYDFNHKKWSGWDTGDHFDPGSVIYD